MPFDATFTFKVGSQRIENVRWSWGTRAAYPDEREDLEGWGTQIETAAVVQMLSLIESGEVEASEVRGLLCRASARLVEEAERPREPVSLPVQRSAPDSPKDDSRLVYVVSSEDSPNMIKIGVTKNLAQRLKSLQSGSGSPLVARWTSPGGLALEGGLHREFQDQAVGGEWFDFSGVDEPVRVIQKAAEKLLRRFERT